MDCNDSVNKILYVTHTDSEGLPPKYFGRSYKMPELLADKIKHYVVNFGEDKQIMKISLKEKRTPDEAFCLRKKRSKSNPFLHGALILTTGSTNQNRQKSHFEPMAHTVLH